MEEEDAGRGGDPGPSTAASGQWMSEHLGTIAHEVKRIADDVKEVQDSRRVRVRPQVGVQTEEKETAEVGVEAEEGGEKRSEEGGEKRSEDGDKDGEGEKETED